ncbi:host cell division inhibitor Icd-like protein [Escherichia coli]
MGGASSEAPVPFDAGYANPVQSTASEIGVSCGGILHCQRRLPTWRLSLPLYILKPPFSALYHLWRVRPQMIHVTAWTEREARNRCPSGCVAVFAAVFARGVPCLICQITST